jgi:ribosomal protein L16/L10AE
MYKKKTKEVKKGKGKGYVKYWAYFIKKNEILFEVKGLNQLVIKKSLIGSKYKLPVKSGLLTKYKN